MPPIVQAVHCAVPPSIVEDGLILHLDATAGSAFTDLSGSGNSGTIGSGYTSPSHISAGDQSYWSFNGTTDSVEGSVGSYNDICALINLTTASPTWQMLFVEWQNKDISLRFTTGKLLPGQYGQPNAGDWGQGGDPNDIFINGAFGAGETDIRDNWAFVRIPRTNNNFTSPEFKYQLSSTFMSRSFKGGIAAILCYDTPLTNAQVQQNWEALRGRFGL